MVELKAKNRDEVGRAVKPLRKEGILPAVVYGEGVKTQSISISGKDFEKAYREAGESTLLTLDVEGKKYNVLIHDIARDPLRGNPIHADFYAVRMDKAIRAQVPVEFIGESPAVKNLGGILVKVMQEIEVEALPKDLPHGLRADLSKLAELEARLTVSDIELPHGVKIIAEMDEVVALVEPPRSEEELAALKETPAVEAPAEVKTEQEMKKEAKERAAADVQTDETGESAGGKAKAK